ncbi:MAG: chitobiase/beta-hexosaminidase C-terminal domain-containing protein [Lachnospiraceae bacterium]|nr:chitobiase/beta-hexosaminidase C-terminal domain-containing protein [Lachnospiraceae bacterium]
MVCSRCGKDIPSGLMFCPECGQAVQMVPDYDLDIEESIAVSSTEIQDSLDKLVDSNGNRRGIEDTVSFPAVRGKVRLFQNAAVLTLGAFILVIILLAGVLLVRRSGNSYDSMIDRARTAYEDGDYKEAVSEYEKALKTAKEKDEVIELNDEINLADSLSRTGRSDDAYSLLHKVLEMDPQNIAAYELIISILKDNGRYEEINKLIAGSQDKDIYSRFAGFMTMPPDFDMAGGEYTEEFDLHLSTENDGAIYYTLDGSKPDSSSELYLEPLHIGEGETVVTAVFINGYDMASPAVSMKYNVNFEAPPDPFIEPESGNFSQPKYITLAVSGNDIDKVTYTTDGTDPTEESKVFENMIPMMLGKNTYKFLSFSKKGVSGNVIEKEYNLNVQGLCTSADATNYVAASLVATGALMDIYGNVPGIKGHYKYLCTKAAKEGSRTYYIVDEYFEDTDGALTETNTAYAVDVISCMMYRANIKPDGRYGFTLFY